MDRRPRKPPAGPLARVRTFFAEDIWRPDADALGFPLAPLYRVLRVVQLAARGIVVHRATTAASALAYTTVLSLVPLLAFAFSIAKGVGAYERLRNAVIEPFLDANLGALGATAPESIRTLREAIERILELVSNTDVSSLGALGLVILVYAVIRVLSNVEDAFNHIWGVRRPRSPVRRVADYLSLAVVTPLLLVLAVALTTAAQNSHAVELMRQRQGLRVLLDGLFGLTPLLSVWTGLTLLYLILPNTRVQARSALLGGIVGGSLWQLAQIGHVRFQIGIANYNAIYSSFAAIPIFLVWVYVSWVTVMFGAEFAHAHQESRHHHQLKIWDLRQPRRRELLVLRALVRIVHRFVHGQPALSPADLAEELAVPLAPLGRSLEPLFARELLVESGSNGDPRWLPGKDPSKVRLSEVLEALRGLYLESSATEPIDREVEAAYRRLHDIVHASPANLDLESLARRAYGEAADH